MPLNKQRLETLRAGLLRRRDELLAELRDDAEHVRAEPFGALAGDARDQADEAVADLIADLEQADLSRDLGELRAVESALQRLKKGTYGTCADCGAEIDAARLKANPAAERCAPCQKAYEKTHATTQGGRL